MAWDSIIGQNRVKKLLQAAFLENRVAHAYCFWGQDGIGKDAMALEFAKLLNCSSPIIENDSVRACDKCPDCRMSNQLQHPNIQLIFSLPRGEKTDTRKDSAMSALSDTQIELVNEQLSLKAQDPYHVISLAKSNQIKIASIREVKKNLSMTSASKGRRMIIISRADEMTGEAANAFLKTLEEPHDNITIILTTSRIDQILQTILSRTQQIRCDTLSDEEVVRYMKIKHFFDDVEARLVAAFAQGSISRAADYLNEDMKEKRQLVVEMLRIALRKKNYRLALFEKIETLLRNNDRRQLEVFVQLVLMWLRDVYCIFMTKSVQSIINIDQEETLRKFSEFYAKKTMPELIENVEKLSSLFNRNVNEQLILLNIFYEMRMFFLEK